MRAGARKSPPADSARRVLDGARRVTRRWNKSLLVLFFRKEQESSFSEEKEGRIQVPERTPMLGASLP
jgi:hypothetical protein